MSDFDMEEFEKIVKSSEHELRGLWLECYEHVGPSRDDMWDLVAVQLLAHFEYGEVKRLYERGVEDEGVGI